MPTAPKRVYVDTNVLSRFTDLKISDDEAYALSKLARRKSEVVLVTSRKTLDEILATPNSKRAAVLELIAMLFHEIPTEPLVSGAQLGKFVLGTDSLGGRTDPTYAALRKVFDEDDAQHITHAVRANCEFFLTFDEATILKRARQRVLEIAAYLDGMRLVNPPELVAILQTEDFANRQVVRAGMAALARLARIDRVTIEEYPGRYTTAEQSLAKLQQLETDVAELEEMLRAVSDEDRLHIASQLRVLYWEYHERAMKHYATSSPGISIRTRVVAGLRMIEEMGGLGRPSP